MNIFRLLGESLLISLHDIFTDLASRFLSSGIDLHSSAEDEVDQRTLYYHLLRPLTTNYLSQSCSGLSFKSQVLYLLVFVTRYLGKLMNSGNLDHHGFLESVANRIQLSID